MAELRDDVPSSSGDVSISDNGFASFVVYTWPIISADQAHPRMNLVLRHRSDGDITLSIHEEWTDNDDSA